RVGCGVVAEQAGRLVDDIGGQIAHEIEMAEAPFRDGLALECLDHLGVGFALRDQLLETRLVDRGETAGEGGFCDDLIHPFPLLLRISPVGGPHGLWIQTGLYMHWPCQFCCGAKGVRNQRNEGLNEIRAPNSRSNQSQTREQLLAHAARTDRSVGPCRALPARGKGEDMDAHPAAATEVDHATTLRPASPRDRLIDAATTLFCRYGVNSVGVDAIVEAAGTAKTTLYKVFGSKDGLVEAVLEREGRLWRDWFITEIDGPGGSAAERLGRIGPTLRKWFSRHDYY